MFYQYTSNKYDHYIITFSITAIGYNGTFEVMISSIVCDLSSGHCPLLPVVVLGPGPFPKLLSDMVYLFECFPNSLWPKLKFSQKLQV